MLQNKKFYRALCGSFFSFLLLSACSQIVQSVDKPIDSQEAKVLFDDFNYLNYKALSENGWKARTQTGHPGVKGAKWSQEGLSFLAASDGAKNGMIRMTSFTDGSGKNTQHTQFCHARKYREGTFAARVFFRDQPTSGADGDEVIETFYVISPLKSDMDLDYSELDFEYLPNGGWEKGEHALWATSWETFKLDPWTFVNEESTTFKSLQGWHTLLLHVADNEARYYIDGKLFAAHSGDIYPEVAMSINFNLWFTAEGLIKSGEKRVYQQDIDWVYHQTKKILSLKEVELQVEKFRKNEIRFIDNVAEKKPKLASPCGL